MVPPQCGEGEPGKGTAVADWEEKRKPDDLHPCAGAELRKALFP